MNENQNDELKIKSWDDLTLADNFIFQKFMMNETLCKKVLSEILGKEVVKIEYPDYEKTVNVRRDAKGIRLDVYIKGEDEVYNIEMQNSDFTDLAKRGRYYNALIDLDLLVKGQDYSELCQSFVIFICTSDIYHKGQYKYTFTYKCDEVKEMEYGDLTTKIVLNTHGLEGNVSENLKTFLNCINGIFSDDEFSATIKKEIEKIKSSRELRREYMTLEIELNRQFKAGEAKGLVTGYDYSIAIMKDLKSGKSIEETAEKYNISISKVQEFKELI